MSNRLEIVNDALRETGLGSGLSTLSGLGEESDEAQVARFAIKARIDVSRKIPNAPLKKQGTIHTVAKVLLAEFFSDKDADGVADNALIILNGDGVVSGVSDNELQVDAVWTGRLFHVVSTIDVYRIHSVDVPDKSFKLADFAGDETVWKDITKSVDSSGSALTRAGVWDATDTYPVGEVGQDRYLLPKDFKVPDNMQNFWKPGVMTYRSPTDFDRLKYEQMGNAFQFGNPEMFTIRQVQISDGVSRWLVELWPIPEKDLMFPFQYEASVTKDWPEMDQSGFIPEYEEAIASRLRWYIYRFLKPSEFNVKVEEGTWREIFKDQQNNPLSSAEQARLTPESHRGHWGTAYDA